MKQFDINMQDALPTDDTLSELLGKAIDEAAERCRVEAGDVSDVIASLDMDALLASSEVELRTDILFRAAEGFGAIDPTLTWKALLESASNASTDNPAFGCTLAMTLDDTDRREIFELSKSRPCLLITEADGGVVVPTSDISGSTFGVLGFPGGFQATLDLSANSQEHCLDLTPEQVRTVLATRFSIVAGIIRGLCRTILDEAFTYARERQSGGKSIISYQAVALRLADMTIATKSLQTYTADLVERLRLGQGDTPTRAETGYVASLAFQIMRDGVQTGGGHGFVEGLPFKSAFERIQSLNALLTLLARAMSETEIKS